MPIPVCVAPLLDVNNDNINCTDLNLGLLPKVLQCCTQGGRNISRSYLQSLHYFHFFPFFFSCQVKFSLELVALLASYLHVSFEDYRVKDSQL